MGSREYLLSLEWNAFETYPEQESAVYIHMTSLDKLRKKRKTSKHKFFKIRKFNAVSFDPTKYLKPEERNYKWEYSWLPASSIDESQLVFLQP